MRLPNAERSTEKSLRMRIERETDRDYRRWSVETHPWVEVSVAAVLCTAVSGGVVAIVGGFARLLG